MRFSFIEQKCFAIRCSINDYSCELKPLLVLITFKYSSVTHDVTIHIQSASFQHKWMKDVLLKCNNSFPSYIWTSYQHLINKSPLTYIVQSKSNTLLRKNLVDILKAKLVVPAPEKVVTHPKTCACLTKGHLRPMIHRSSCILA